MPQVSVIIPNYNHALFLKARIDSVLNQSFKDFEIILLDDCSTDASREVMEVYREEEKVAHIVFNERNSGSPFAQWKKGVELSKGEYIWIAESDDLAEESFLQTLMEGFDRYPDLLLAYCKSKMIDLDGNFLKLADWMDPLDAQRWNESFVCEAQEEGYYLGFRNIILNASAVLFKKQADLDFDSIMQMRFLGDWIFWKSLLNRKGKVFYTAVPLSSFRSHVQSTRTILHAKNELQLFAEYKKLVPAGLLSPLEGRYDWIIQQWEDRTELFKNTRYQYFPALPLSLYSRYVLLRTVGPVYRRLKWGTKN